MLFHLMYWIHRISGRAAANLLAKRNARKLLEEARGVNRWGCCW